jgi:hypothetical protein
MTLCTLPLPLCPQTLSPDRSPIPHRYDMTPHVLNHEGWTNGAKQSTLLAILSAMGQDCTEDFDEVHSDRAKAQLASFKVGTLQSPNLGCRAATYKTWDQLVEAGKVPADGDPTRSSSGLPTSAGHSAPVVENSMPMTLCTIPALLLQHILCVGGNARSADTLSCTSHALAQAVAGLSASVLPIFPPPDQCEAFACSPNAVKWDPRSGTLRKLHGLGHSLIVFDEVLQTRDTVLLLDLLRLPVVGAVQVGIRGFEDTGRERPRCFINYWCDGAGRLVTYDDSSMVCRELLGETVREGDRVGAFFFASSCTFGFSLNGRLMGPPIPLSTRCRCFRFALRFDHVPGAEVQLVRSCAAPLDLEAVLASAVTPNPRRPPEDDRARSILVRTLGPDSRIYSVDVDPAQATVAELAHAVAELLGCGETEHVHLTCNGHVLYSPEYHSSGTTGAAMDRIAGTDLLVDAATTCFHGRCQLHDITASFTHMHS